MQLMQKTMIAGLSALVLALAACAPMPSGDMQCEGGVADLSGAVAVVPSEC
ncbi:MAG: hypothetical protein R3D78_05420 [Paracoccaceae bacterium]|jgi:hypothetical protein